MIWRLFGGSTAGKRLSKQLNRCFSAPGGTRISSGKLTVYRHTFLRYTSLYYSKDEWGMLMLALQGYFDGNEIRTLEKIRARKNQKLIITILDEFIEESSLKDSRKQSARGLLSEYANSELQKEEESAWEKAVEEKYGNA